MKKILLINLPISIYVNKTAFIPLPLLVLGTCLKQVRQDGHDFSYEIVDMDLMLKQGILSDDENFYRKASDLILGKKPDVLLFTVHGLNHIVVLKLSRIIKRELPSCLTVVGGVGPTLMASEAMRRCEDIDVIVKGEGETVLKHLIPEALNGRNFSAVPSVVYRENGQIMENPRLSLAKDEPLPSPDYSIVDTDEYLRNNKKNPYIHPGFVLIESGRGCPFRCTFCAPAKMWESTVRYRPVEEIIAEMKFLAAKGFDFSFFTQDNLEEKFLTELSGALISGGSKIPWGCYSRLDRLSESSAGMLAKAGCKLIFTGFETPNRKMQKTIRKVVDTVATFEKLQAFNEQGISMIGSFMAGFNEETDEDLDNTMNYAIECATGLRFEDLNKLLAQTAQDSLPQKGKNICLVHPLCYMPGTDSFEQEKDSLHISRYSLHPDCYGSYLFRYDEFKDDWSYLSANPYLNHLPEPKVRFYCSILRLFNLLNQRPYYFALLLKTLGEKPLDLMKKMVAEFDEEFVLTAKIDEFEAKNRAYVSRYLEFVPSWTVKKGQ
jgi:radical SAM superfamily enzyme YgiQ (UPF0313 family)